MNWYLKALRQYFVISGRAQRSEYWFFVLFSMLIVIALTMVDALLGTTFDDQGHGIFGSLYSLFILIPSFTVSARRLHDTNRSAWWLLIGLIPVAGAIVLLLFYCIDSDPGSNRFGPNPKGG